MSLKKLSINQSIQFWNEKSILSESNCRLPDYRFIHLLKSDSKVLDIGCGTGRVLHSLEKLGLTCPLFGIDWAIKPLEVAMMKHPKLNLCTGDSRSLPFKNEIFDACILSALLTCIPNEEDIITLLNEVYRITKLYGYLLISDFLIDFQPRNLLRYIVGYIKYGKFGIFDAVLPFRHFTKHRLKNYLETTNFRIISFDCFRTVTCNNNNQMGVIIIGQRY